jgi:DNA-binding response OmpR family regulator
MLALGVGATIGQAELHRVVLVEGDQYYREVLTVELLRQGFIVHAFTDGASLSGSLATAVDADLAVLDWDLSEMPGKSYWLNCAGTESTCPPCS